MLKTKNSKWIIFSAIVLTVVIVLGFFLLNRNNREKQVEKLLTLAEKYYLQLDYENAILAFQQALELDEDCVRAYLGIADASLEQSEQLLLQGKPAEAVACLENAIQILSRGYERTGDLEIDERLKGLQESLNRIKQLDGTDMVTQPDNDSSAASGDESGTSGLPSENPSETPSELPQMQVSESELHQMAGMIAGVPLFDLTFEDFHSILQEKCYLMNQSEESDDTCLMYVYDTAEGGYRDAGSVVLSENGSKTFISNVLYFSDSSREGILKETVISISSENENADSANSPVAIQSELLHMSFDTFCSRYGADFDLRKRSDLTVEENSGTGVRVWRTEFETDSFGQWGTVSVEMLCSSYDDVSAKDEDGFSNIQYVITYVGLDFKEEVNYVIAFSTNNDVGEMQITNCSMSHFIFQ